MSLGPETSGSPPPELTAGSISDPPISEGSASPFLSGLLADPSPAASGAGVVGEVPEAPPALLPFLLSPPAASAAASSVRFAGFPAGRTWTEQKGPARKEGGGTAEGPVGEARQLSLSPPSAV